MFFSLSIRVVFVFIRLFLQFRPPFNSHLRADPILPIDACVDVNFELSWYNRVCHLIVFILLSTSPRHLIRALIKLKIIVWNENETQRHRERNELRKKKKENIRKIFYRKNRKYKITKHVDLLLSSNDG